MVDGRTKAVVAAAHAVTQLVEKPQQRQDFEQLSHEHSPLQPTVSIGSARGGGEQAPVPASS
jgi:hypothetical protein